MLEAPALFKPVLTGWGVLVPEMRKDLHTYLAAFGEKGFEAMQTMGPKSEPLDMETGKVASG